MPPKNGRNGEFRSVDSRPPPKIHKDQVRDIDFLDPQTVRLNNPQALAMAVEDADVLAARLKGAQRLRAEQSLGGQHTAINHGSSGDSFVEDLSELASALQQIRDSTMAESAQQSRPSSLVELRLSRSTPRRRRPGEMPTSDLVKPSDLVKRSGGPGVRRNLSISPTRRRLPGHMQTEEFGHTRGMPTPHTPRMESPYDSSARDHVTPRRPATASVSRSTNNGHGNLFAHDYRPSIAHLFVPLTNHHSIALQPSHSQPRPGHWSQQTQHVEGPPPASLARQRPTTAPSLNRHRAVALALSNPHASRACGEVAQEIPVDAQADANTVADKPEAGSLSDASEDPTMHTYLQRSVAHHLVRSHAVTFDFLLQAPLLYLLDLSTWFLRCKPRDA